MLWQGSGTDEDAMLVQYHHDKERYLYVEGRYYESSWNKKFHRAIEAVVGEADQVTGLGGVV